MAIWRHKQILQSVSIVVQDARPIYGMDELHVYSRMDQQPLIILVGVYRNPKK